MEQFNPDNSGQDSDLLADVMDIIRLDSPAAPDPNSELPPARRPNLRVVITEQPDPVGVRYRYESEVRASNLHGAHSTEALTTYPTIAVEGPDAGAIVDLIVVVSCVTSDQPHRPHPHKIIGDNCEYGVCRILVTNGCRNVSFTSLGIQCMRRRDVEQSLKLRADRNINPFRTATTANQSYDMNTVRLCFQVYVRTVAHGPRYALRPVVSQPVRDKRDNLIIHKLSHAAGSARGGQQIILLCERVKKEEIQVEFRQLDAATGLALWSDFGRFDETDVHRQVAITFVTPAFRDPDTTESQVCWIRLLNRRTRAFSEDRRYEYYPKPSEAASQLRHKRARQNQVYLDKIRQIGTDIQRQPRHQPSHPIAAGPPANNPSLLPSFGVAFSVPATAADAPTAVAQQPLATGGTPVTLHHRNVPFPMLVPVQPVAGTFSPPPQPPSTAYTLTDLSGQTPALFTPADITMALNQIDQCVRSGDLDQMVRELQHLPPPPSLQLPQDIDDLLLLDGTERLRISN